MASSDVNYPVVFRATKAEADALCTSIDTRMGLPNARMVRWTEPIEQADGTWAVQLPDATVASRVGVALSAKRSLDLIATRKRTAEEIAEADVKPAKTVRTR